MKKIVIFGVGLKDHKVLKLGELKRVEIVLDQEAV